MAFHSKQQLIQALDWFNANPRKCPKPMLDDTFTDDHEVCYVVSFGDQFTYTFWYTSVIFDIARSDLEAKSSKIVRDVLASQLEAILDESTDNLYQCDTGLGREGEQFEIDEELQLRMFLFITTTQNLQG